MGPGARVYNFPMSSGDPRGLTQLLNEIAAGRTQAAEELLPLVYTELRKLARSRLGREAPGRSLGATSLVHEAYVRLVGDPEYRWENRGHFFAAAAEAMRRIVIDRARARNRIKRGGDMHRIPLPIDLAGEGMSPEQVLALNEALSRLERQDPRMADVVKLRCFAGLTVPETSRALTLSSRTVNRLWTAARAWLRDNVGG